MSYNIIESYSWMAPQWKVADQSPKKVRIKGKALFAFEKFFKKGVSGNHRKYIDEEIKLSARTLANVPIDVNHEISLWEEATGHNWSTYRGKKPKAKGHVIWGEYEDGELEYVAEVNDPVYREKVMDTWKVRNKTLTAEEYLAKWGKSSLEGVSVDADFLHLRCSKCNDGKRYFDLNEYKKHMWEAHFIKNFEIEPRGIKYKRLSLVESPEKPGVEGAGFELVETQRGMLKLYEALIQDAAIYHPPIVEEGNPYQSYIPEKGLTQQKEITEMNEEKTKTTDTPRYAISPDTRVMFDPRADYDFTAKEQVEDDGPPAEVQECPAGQHWDAERQECVPDAEDDPAATVTEQDEGDHECDEGYHWSEEENMCVPDEAPAVEEQMECPEGMHWDATQNTCVPNEPPIDTPATVEVMRLGEPFADYTSFDDCVAKNRDKDDPEAYCARIKNDVEETKIRRIVREELAKHSESLAEKQLREKQELDAKQRDEIHKAEIKKLQEANKQLGFNVAHVHTALKTALTEITSVKKDNANLRGQIMGVGAIQKGVLSIVKSLQETREHTHSEFDAWKESLDNVSSTVTEHTSRWDGYRENVDKTITGINEKIDTTTSEVTTKLSELSTNAVNPQTLQEMLPTDITKRLGDVEQYIIDQRATAAGRFKGNPPPPKNIVGYENPDNPHTSY